MDPLSPAIRSVTGRSHTRVRALRDAWASAAADALLDAASAVSSHPSLTATILRSLNRRIAVLTKTRRSPLRARDVGDLFQRLGRQGTHDLLTFMWNNEMKRNWNGAGKIVTFSLPEGALAVQHPQAFDLAAAARRRSRDCRLKCDARLERLRAAYHKVDDALEANASAARLLETQNAQAAQGNAIRRKRKRITTSQLRQTFREETELDGVRVPPCSVVFEKHSKSLVVRRFTTDRNHVELVRVEAKAVGHVTTGNVDARDEADCVALLKVMQDGDSLLNMLQRIGVLTRHCVYCGNQLSHAESVLRCAGQKCLSALKAPMDAALLHGTTEVLSSAAAMAYHVHPEEEQQPEPTLQQAPLRVVLLALEQADPVGNNVITALREIVSDQTHDEDAQAGRIVAEMKALLLPEASEEDATVACLDVWRMLNNDTNVPTYSEARLVNAAMLVRHLSTGSRGMDAWLAGLEDTVPLDAVLP